MRDGTEPTQAFRESLPDPAVIFQSARLVVIDKPSGMLSVPGKGPDKQDCAIARVKKLFPHARGPMIVHRLDTDTSGLLAVALDERTQRDLSIQFEERRVEKAYLALVDSTLDHAPDSGEISLPLRTDIDNRPYQIVDHTFGKPAQTRYRILARELDRARLRLEPITGRTHQLRVHCAHAEGLRAPILGDVLYGSASTFPRLALHAEFLSLFDPDNPARRIEFHAPAPF